MTYADFKDLPKATTSNKLLSDKAFFWGGGGINIETVFSVG